MIKQCKGKDINKVPKLKLDIEGPYYASIKYDGHYVQIHKNGNKVRFFTGGGKEFYVSDLAAQLLHRFRGVDFILEAEFIGLDEGKLGGRTKVGILTTWRTEFSKGLSSKCLDNKFKVFDIIDTTKEFKDRVKLLQELATKFPSNLELVDFKVMNLNQAKKWSYDVCRRGWEGVFAKSAFHMYRPGKRVNDAIKLKRRPTADLSCIDVEEGTGKYEGMIGSLVLVDSEDRIVKVGSGLDDLQRTYKPNYFIGKVVEIEYEQILDTYIQPVFVRIREDKNKED